PAEPVLADAKDFECKLNEAGDGIEIAKYKGTQKAIIIPAEIEGLPVKTLQKNFLGEESQVEIVLCPDSITNFGGYSTFADARALKKVVLSKNLENIPDFCFSRCENLVEVEISSAEQMGDEGVLGCSSLEKITWPQDCNSIRRHAFAALENLKIVDMSLCENISIEDEAFRYCTNLTDVIFPKTVESIHTNAFENCAALTNVTLPEKVGEFSENARNNIGIFGNCSSLPIATQAALRKLGDEGEV
ncbi:MAG: leucine-rich repeat domain-containing protein, partial [Clostridia bacterium]|nr:leucine-rich repeat domain-containing protein [Clostridia bacterium]